jgi:hypothetical protein
MRSIASNRAGPLRPREFNVAGPNVADVDVEAPGVADYDAADHGPANTTVANTTAKSRSSIARAFAPTALILALCAACATTPRPMLSREAKVLDLPLVEQDEMYACGLVSVKALCQYWNMPISPAESDRLARMAREHEGL